MKSIGNSYDMPFDFTPECIPWGRENTSKKYVKRFGYYIKRIYLYIMK